MAFGESLLSVQCYYWLIMKASVVYYNTTIINQNAFVYRRTFLFSCVRSLGSGQRLTRDLFCVIALAATSGRRCPWLACSRYARIGPKRAPEVA
eukprot:scaffold23239_cov17-Prasinocladus_malaysianus.AAC.1